MQDQKNVVDCYNKSAKDYAGHYFSEFDGKHLDRILLRAFAAENKDKGRLIDLGCGPGQATKFLSDCGVADIIGTDLSPKMVEVAKGLSPHIDFEVADMLELKYADDSLGSAVAFYAIVHFDAKQLAMVFNEIYRILKKGGEFLFSFHIGNETVHRDEFLGHEVNIDFYFLEVESVLKAVEEAGFHLIDVIKREPYADAEYPSKRAYIWAGKK